jgi:hypothetical protein
LPRLPGSTILPISGWDYRCAPPVPAILIF